MKSLTSQPLLAVDYPAGRKEVIERRLEKLEKYGISLENFIAKGYRGTVFSGKLTPSDYFSTPIKIAIKFARSDAGKENFILREAEILEYLSHKDFVPAVYFYNREMLVMEFVHGEPFESKVFINRENFKEIFSTIVEKCYLMDELGVEHRELRGKGHIIVDGLNVKFIDFESGRFTESPRNLFQFLGAHLLNLQTDILEDKNIDIVRIRKGIKIYSHNRKEGVREIFKGVGV